MTNATVAVKGSASNDFPADYARVTFWYEFDAPKRSEALAGANTLIAEVRDVAAHLGEGVREMKVASVRVDETFNHDGRTNIHEHAGWVARVSGQMLLTPSVVPVATAALIKTGARIDQLSWHLERDSELEARRAVRRLAVADARQAALDFALALGASLGDLVTLADPGLLGAATYASAARRSSSMVARATSLETSWDDSVDIDPEMVTISAHVEAVYEVIVNAE